MLTFGSLFSGIGGFDLGFERAGMECAWQVEIDRKASEVLAKHWPDVARYTDVRTVGKHNLESVDVICGGFPCQDLSVAGKRAGLAGERSGLWFEFARIIDELEPGAVVIENVPGLLSSDRGADFAVLLQWLVKRGYGVAWRVLDAQYFGVAQRRRRVFVVASFGSGCAAQILFEREGVRWNPPARGKAGEGITPTVAFSAGNSGESYGIGYGEEVPPPFRAGESGTNQVPTVCFGGNNTSGPINVATAQNAHGGTGRIDFESETFVAFNADRSGQDANENVFPTLTHKGDSKEAHGAYPKIAVAFNIQHNDGGEHKRKDRPNGGMYVNETDTALTVGTTDLTAIAWQDQGGSRMDFGENVTPTMRAHDHGHPRLVGVRRLTPIECARLQGFPDDWNDWLADSSRYKQFGNAVCVNVAEWIGRRIVEAQP